MKSCACKEEYLIRLFVCFCEYLLEIPRTILIFEKLLLVSKLYELTVPLEKM